MNRRLLYLVSLCAGALALAVVALSAPQGTAEAQCGSQASSCKNCHEVQGALPVNADGTGWHQSHAFGDFCYLCHAGNNQAMDKAVAHTAMVAPLSDVEAACQQCHAADLDERAQVYAVALGVEIGSGASTTTVVEVAAAAPVSEASAPAVQPVQSCNELVVDDPNAINYAENYDAIVLGQQPVNWGNVILIGMIGLVAVGGGGLIVTREKLVTLAFGDTRRPEGEYPAEVVAMLPQIAGLKAKTRKSLQSILDQPQKADKVLDLIEAVVSAKTDEE